MEILNDSLMAINFKFPSNVFLKNYYDIAFYIASSLEYTNRKYIIACCSGLLSGRCMTFKGSDQNKPLTDQYYCPTISDGDILTRTFTYDAKQTFSRIASVHDCQFERIL